MRPCVIRFSQRNSHQSPRIERLAFAAVLVFSLSGCSAVTYLWDVTSDTERVTLAATPDANDDFPVAVDLVAVREKAFVDVIASTGANAWFEQREDFIRSNVDAIEVRHFEVIPGQRIEKIEYSFDERRTYFAIFAFADYPSTQSYRARLDSYETPTLILGAEGITVEPGS